MNSQLLQELEELGGELLPSNLRECDEIVIDQPGFSARIALWGGHLVSYKPAGQKDLLFQSKNEGGKTRFGRRHFGIPVCWPWFGAYESDENYPSHGLARYFRWEFVEAGRFKNGDVKIVLKLASQEHPLVEEMWSQAFELRLVFRFSDHGFSINFSAANLSDTTMTISEAFHSYFRVGDNQSTEIRGLEDLDYVDKFDEGTIKQQDGPVSPCDTMDRVYINVPNTCEVCDVKWQRKLVISSKGSHSTVLWNPGKNLAMKRKDMEDEEYRKFVCVETSNALDNTYELAPGELHQMKVKVQVEALEG